MTPTKNTVDLDYTTEEEDSMWGHGTEEHWNANGESYCLIAESMGNEMVRILDKGLPNDSK